MGSITEGKFWQEPKPLPERGHARYRVRYTGQIFKWVGCGWLYVGIVLPC